MTTSIPAGQLTKLKQAAKLTTFTLSLSKEELDYLQRTAGALDLDWKAFFRQQIKERVLDRSGHIGQPLISGPSFAAKRIQGPSIS